MPRTSTRSLLLWKSLLLAPLVFALYLIERHHEEPGEYDEQQGNSIRYPAFITALRGHAPSLRVFRGLFEFTLVLICTSISLRVWELTLDRPPNYDSQKTFQD